jgi:CBS domain-containing protein
MLVRELLEHKRKKLVTCHPENTLAIAAELLATNRIGAIPVLTAEGDLAGIVSERDLVREFATRSSEFQTLKIAAIMTRNVITVSPDETVPVAAGRMVEHGIRHLPVVEGRKVRAVISIRDTVSARLAKAASRAKRLGELVDRVR